MHNSNNTRELSNDACPLPNHRDLSSTVQLQPRRAVSHTVRLVGAAVIVTVVGGLAGGCQRTAEPQFAVAPQVEQLDEPLQQALAEQLLKRCGTPNNIKLLGADDVSAERLKHGAEVYRNNCQQCHGVSGDGAGPAAEYLSPRPRDYRRGIFKFTSTPYGYKPRREDLLRTISRGIVGTSMPSFRRLPKRDLEDVVDYVLALTHRGELETRLVAQAQGDDEITDEAADEVAQSIVDQWHSAGDNVVEPVSKMPPITPESIAAGAAIFQKRECVKCHGANGRGGLAGNIEVGQDAWGHKGAAADLTSGMLRGGQNPLDVYRRIYAGINGTPMPAFKEMFANDPQAIWNLTHFVLDLADQRRHGVQFPRPALNPAAPPVAEPATPTESSP